MTTMQVVVLLIVVVVLAGLAAAGWLWWRRQALRNRFGPEYDRVVSEQDSRMAAERELRDRERRHAQLTLEPLPAESRQHYTEEWERVQAMFLDDPAAAVVAGDELVTRLVAERGYPTEDFDEQAAYLSVEHANTLGHYRDAHNIYLRNEQGTASTEELRQALVHYRALFGELLETDLGPDASTENVAERFDDRTPDGFADRTPNGFTDRRSDRPLDGDRAPDTVLDRDRITDAADQEPMRTNRSTGGPR
jgi:hypothetical protein